MKLIKNVLLFRVALVVCIVLVSYLAFTPIDHTVSSTANDKVNHIAAFFVLSFLLDFSMQRKRFEWWMAVALFGYGILIETIQHFLPFRDFSLYDAAADLVGVAAYVASLPLLRVMPLIKSRWGA